MDIVAGEEANASRMEGRDVFSDMLLDELALGIV